jgi:CMP-N-acetylneuraminic acid synthetase
MLKGKTFLAIIPARGGSKRLPRKNILNLGGKPLIGWSIEAALGSRYIDKIVVTSDDDNILKIAEQYHVKIIKRPPKLASDTALTYDVVKHTIETIQKKYDYIVLLQPTSPLRNNLHIDDAIESLFNKNADAIVSVTETDHSPLWSNILPENGSMENFLRRDILQKRSQELEKYYRINGAIYIVDTNILLKDKTIFPKKNIYAYIMDRFTSIDIDEKIDFEIASFLVSKR